MGEIEKPLVLLAFFDFSNYSHLCNRLGIYDCITIIIGVWLFAYQESKRRVKEKAYSAWQRISGRFKIRSTTIMQLVRCSLHPYRVR